MGVKELVQKYSTSGPRYTSYPTAPQWNQETGLAKYREVFRDAYDCAETEPLAMYIHLPFCEALCYYCGCNIQITKDHKRSETYLNALECELATVGAWTSKKLKLSQISWGGGTPTFLSCDEITRLHTSTRKYFDLAQDAEVSIEIDPRVTTSEQLRTLRSLGFNRVSLGVQDFNDKVQVAVNRVQSVKMTGDMLKLCRSLGYTGVNFDLIYGLPFQSLESFERTLDEVLQLRPDRIALYNYAHLPSLRPHQKILEAMPRPDANERLDIFLKSLERLEADGYLAIGMDHFALKEDDLSKALETGKLYRNFMGYSVNRGNGMIGIGASAIGEINGSYFQNIREAKDYEATVNETGVASFRGCLISEDDAKRKWVIQSLMCRFNLSYTEYSNRFNDSFKDYFAKELSQLDSFLSEGILSRDGDGIRVTEVGRLFIRNVAMKFDAYLNLPTGATYSKTL